MMHRPSIIIIVLFVQLVVAQAMCAQTTFGIRGGINIAGLDAEAFETENIVAFQIGIYMNASFWDSPLSIQPEIIYSKNGAVINGKRIELSYIKVPLLFKYTFKQTSEFSTYMLFGPYVSFNIEDKNNLIDTSVGDNLNSTLLGGVIGVGSNIKHFSIDLRYSRAALPYSERKDAGFQSIFTITAGIGF